MPIYYHDYLQLEKILESQHPESAKHGVHAHDEMLFIIIHQAYELWFKQLLVEIDSVISILGQEQINDNKGDLGVILRRMNRISEIWKLLIQQISVLETMSSQDFYEFRNFLTPASGFQSKQFKLIEAKLGLEMKDRFGGEYYKRQNPNEGGFDTKDYLQISNTESEATLKQLLIKWLERMPFLLKNHWKNSEPEQFWTSYQTVFLGSLNEKEDKTARLEEFRSVFFEEGLGNFTPAALRSALFITLYRDYPLFHLPFQVLTEIKTLDETMSIFRHRHLMMVSRMIGMRVGTGGINKQGKNQEGYLEGALRQHKIFRELSELATFLVERRHVPEIPVEVMQELQFRMGTNF